MERQEIYEKVAKLLLAAFIVMMACLIVVYAHSVETNKIWEFISYVCPCAAGVFAGAGLYFGRKADTPVVSPAKAPPQPQECHLNRDGIPPSVTAVASVDPEANVPKDPQIPTVDASAGAMAPKVQSNWQKLRGWSPDDRFFYVLSVFLLFAGLLAYVEGHAECQKPAIMVAGIALSSICVVCYTLSLSNEKSNSSFWGIASLLWAIFVIGVPIVCVVGIFFLPAYFVNINGFLKCQP